MESINTKITTLRNEIENLKGVIERKLTEIRVLETGKKSVSLEKAKETWSELQEEGDVQSLVAFLCKRIPQTEMIVGTKWTKMNFHTGFAGLIRTVRFDKQGNAYTTSGKVPLFNLFSSPYEEVSEHCRRFLK